MFIYRIDNTKPENILDTTISNGYHVPTPAKEEDFNEIYFIDNNITENKNFSPSLSNANNKQYFKFSDHQSNKIIINLQ